MTSLLCQVLLRKKVGVQELFQFLIYASIPWFSTQEKQSPKVQLFTHHFITKQAGSSLINISFTNVSHHRKARSIGIILSVWLSLGLLVLIKCGELCAISKSHTSSFKPICEGMVKYMRIYKCLLMSKYGDVKTTHFQREENLYAKHLVRISGRRNKKK